MSIENIDMSRVILPENKHWFRISDETLQVPEGIEGIVGAFRGDNRVRILRLPDGLRLVGDSAFNYCENLEVVEFPCTLEEIGEHAFAGCRKLKNVVLPSELKRIGSYAFAHCSSLGRIEIPPSVSDFGEEVFHDCPTNLTFVVQAGSPVCRVLQDMGCVRVEYECWDDQQTSMA